MNLPVDVCLLVADWGIGDHYLVGGFADAVRRHYGVRVWLSGRESLAFIAGLYPAVERYVPWPADQDPKSLHTERIAPGRPFYAHFPQLELMRAVGYNGFHFLDAYRCRLGLPVTAGLTRPRLPAVDEVAAAAQLLTAHGLPQGNTVILSVEARTTPTTGVDAAFWTALAAELGAAGFAVVVNAGPTTVVPAGLRGLDVPLAAFRAAVQAAGFFCSVRSGLSDLVCDLRCPQVTVYPDVRYWAGTLLEGTTFGRFGLTKAPHEVVMAPGGADERARSLAGYFAARRPRSFAVPPPAGAGR